MTSGAGELTWTTHFDINGSETCRGTNPRGQIAIMDMVEWLHCLPSKLEIALLDPVFRLGLFQRFGYPAGGKQCAQILDPYGRHAACCTKGLHTLQTRSHQGSDHQTCGKPGKGLTATEQAMLIPDQIMADGQPAPGSVRPIHRADVHINEPQGSEIWLDVKIHTMAPELSVAKELLREEQTTCRAHGQREGYDLQALDKRMTPVVLEQNGRTAPGSQTVFNRIIHHRLRLLV